MAKLRVAILFGGRSVEHEVSVASATSIAQALDPERYETRLVCIGHDGRWRLGPPGSLPASLEASLDRGDEVWIPAVPGTRQIQALGSTEPLAHIDVVLPIVHGTGGEDGRLQGLLDLTELPYVGAGVLGSAIQMDKEVSKRLLAAAGLPVVPWITVRTHELDARGPAIAERAVRELGLPVFVKPAGQGSSIGISKVAEPDGIGPALAEAARYDTKLLIERAIDGREIEVAVIGSDAPEASLPGEIVPTHEFYDYEAKYLDEGTELLIPAPLEEAQIEALQRLAVDSYVAVEGEGLGRVDFFLERHTGLFFVSEVNSLPGFTDASMFPKLWEATGVSYPALLDRLIEQAIARGRERSRLETLYRAP